MLIERLVLNYGLMVASEPLMREAHTLSTLPALKEYYERHLDEELDHAAWLYEDLASAGITPPYVDWRAAQIAGTQYYLIRHVSPDALLGYMAVLECGQPSPDQLDAAEAKYGKDLTRTLRYHAEHDVEHGRKLLEFINTTPGLNMALIEQNAQWTVMSIQSALE